MRPSTKHRLLTDYLLRDANRYPVVTLTGPRQSRKTTLVKAGFPWHRYFALEALDQREFAREDPRGVLGPLDGPVILDEIQHAPELLPFIQAMVDQNPAPGRFVLTGSQNFDESVKTRKPDGFEKSSSSRRANLEERGVLMYAAATSRCSATQRLGFLRNRQLSAHDQKWI